MRVDFKREMILTMRFIKGRFEKMIQDKSNLHNTERYILGMDI